MGFQDYIVEKMGLEPTTSWLPVKRSSQLSYIPILNTIANSWLTITICWISTKNVEHKVS